MSRKPGHAASALLGYGMPGYPEGIHKPGNVTADSANKGHRINLRFRTAKNPAHKKSDTLDGDQRGQRHPLVTAAGHPHHGRLAAAPPGPSLRRPQALARF